MADPLSKAAAPLTEPLTDQKPDFIDFMIGGAMKKPMESIIAKTPVGDGNLVSGLLKIGGAFCLSKIKTGNALTQRLVTGGCIAAAVDGSEDLTVTAKRWMDGRTGASTRQENASAMDEAW